MARGAFRPFREKLEEGPRSSSDPRCSAEATEGLGLAKVRYCCRPKVGVGRLTIYATEPLLHAKVHVAGDVAAVASPNF